jgi:hypothetical protein
MNHLRSSANHDQQPPALPGVQQSGSIVRHFKTTCIEILATASRPKGPSVNSQGREPLERRVRVLQASTGRKSLSPRWGCHGLIHVYQGLTPLAINDRRVAAETDACNCISFKAGRSRRRGSNLRPRCGSVLVLTLVVVAMLTLGAAAFFERMLAEHQAERAHGQQLQASQLADSGVEYMKVLLSRDPKQIQDAGGLYANPSLFQGIVVNEDPMAAFRGRATFFAPELTADGYFGGIRYGLENESARLNLNTVLLADAVKEGNAKQILMGLPGMTEMLAEAILDWIDPDDDQRESGAERDYYGSLEPPYAPRNGPLGSIE